MDKLDRKNLDYLMRITVPDIDAYDAVYRRLISAIGCLDVSANFSLPTIKHTTALPLYHAPFGPSTSRDDAGPPT